jgi:hypothetical protein
MDGIALHITFRLGKIYLILYIKAIFIEHGKPSEVVFNTYKGHWGSESKHQAHVNIPGPVNIHVESHHKHYVIGINGKTYEYKHRMKTSEINRIEIDGDLRIQKLSFANMDNHIHLLGNYHQSHHRQ